MKLSRIKLVNVGNHINSEFVVPDDAKLIAISGPTGSGKTTLLESPFIALYGRSIFRSGNVYELGRRGFQGECLIEAEFVNEKSIIVARREWMQGEAMTGRGHTTFWNDEKLKIGEFNEKVMLAFGDLDMITVTNYSSQNRVNFFGMEHYDRKKVLGSLLAPTIFARCDDTSAAAGDQRKLQEKEVVRVDVEQEVMTKSLSELQESQKEIPVLEADLAKLKGRKDIVQKSMNSLHAKGAEITTRIEGIHELVGKKKAYSLQIARLQEEEGELIVQDVEILESKAEEIKAVQAMLHDLLCDNNFDQIKEEYESVCIKITGQAAEIDELNKSLNHDQIELHQIKRQKELLGEVPCEDDMQERCSFVSDAFKNAKREISLQKEVDKALLQNQAKEKEQVKILDRQSWILDFMKQVDEHRKRLFTLDYEERLQKTKAEKQSLIQERLEGIAEEIKQAQGELNQIQILETASLQISLDDIRKEWLSQKDILDEMDNLVKKAEANIVLAIENAERVRKYTDALNVARGELKLLHQNLSAVRLVEEGFSKRGIQSMILSREMEFLERLTQDYLDLIFPEQDVQIQLLLQRKLKSDLGVMEVLEPIIMFDGRMLRAMDLSGGQRQAIELAFREGLLTYQSLKSQLRLEFCVLDEPTSDTDEALSKNILNSLMKLCDFFKQVFVISYDEDLMVGFPNRIRLVEEDGNAKILL